ncbi:hypothetical protein F4561_000634 [Lipingzhangella halophila]|uniref:Uncharacterized protein n=1 Tax=Lipingzhangella halophila TaxID=1783352 RepID=A0A7W7RD97_9ACTN|nr:hypothetical protein [Lipingzhangella halophila]MBB4929814.1 hypothetical protein [Lipingzhangella halophila]
MSATHLPGGPPTPCAFVREVGGRPLTRYELRKRRTLAETAGQTWAFFAAWESIPYVAAISVAMLIGQAPGID